jgi:phosphoribosylamine-glycine ligase
MKNNAIILGGGSDQAYLVIRLKELGYFTIIIDYYNNPIAKEYCDLHIQESSLDYEKVKSIAIEWKAKYVIAVCTDQALYIAAKVSEDLGLYFPIDSKTALNVTNKRLMKDILMNNNIPTPKAVVGKSFEEIKQNIEIHKLKFPLVIKPVDANSSKGVILLDDIKVLEEAFHNSMEFSREKTVIVEEYIKGKEISIDGYIANNEHYFLMATESEKLNENIRNDFPICRSFYDKEHERKVENLAKKRIDEIAKAFSITSGPLLIQCIYSNNELYVIELSARTGGGSKIHFIKEVTSIDVIDLFLKDIEKKQYNINIHKNINYAMMVYIYSNSGIFSRVEGLNLLKSKKIIKDYFLYKTKNMIIKGNSNSSDRLGAVFIIGDNPEEIKYKLLEIKKNLKAYDIDGKELQIIGSF